MGISRPSVSHSRPAPDNWHYVDLRQPPDLLTRRTVGWIGRRKALRLL